MKSLISISVFLFTTYALAVVDMRNANFAHTWVDLEVPGAGYDLKVNRTYNSRSLFSGIFGYGWCSEFETTIAFTAEGNIKLTECGAGQEIYFTPREFGRKDVDKTIAKIIEKVKAAKKPSEKELQSLARDMVFDHDLRSKFAVAYKVAVPVKEGTKFFANGKEVENIAFANGIYTRYMADGSYQRFSKEGRLTHYYDKNGNFLKLDYDKDLLVQVIDNNGKRLSLKYSPNKKIRSIVGPNNMEATYKFSNNDDLSSVKNAWNNTYNYEYDDLHNLTKATFPDNTFIALTYDKKNDWVTSFTDRDKCLESYTYEFSEKEPKYHYWSSVNKVCGKEQVAKSRYEFWYAAAKDGSIFLQRVKAEVNGNPTDITYHETYGKPIFIQRGDQRFNYEYYPNGQVASKQAERLKLSYKYDAKSGKVTEVVSHAIDEKGKLGNPQRTVFRYDGKSNLTYAENSYGQKITMTYDNKGRISTITDQAKKVVKIEYEERFGKPAIVKRPGLGTISVSYKQSGEIDKVTSPEGQSVAMQVASTFNNLLDIISPATAEVFN